MIVCDFYFQEQLSRAFNFYYNFTLLVKRTEEIWPICLICVRSLWILTEILYTDIPNTVHRLNLTWSFFFNISSSSKP